MSRNKRKRGPQLAAHQPNANATSPQRPPAPGVISGASPAPAVAPASPSPSTPQAVLSAVETWALWRLCAAGPWLWIAAAIIQRATGHELPCPGALFFAPAIPLLFYAVRGNFLWAGGVLVYTSVFPFFVVWKVAMKAPRSAATVARVCRATTSLWAAALYLVTLVLLSAALLAVGRSPAVPWLIYAQLSLLMMFLLTVVRLAADPLWPFHSLLALINLGQTTCERLPPTSHKTPEEEKTHGETMLKILNGFEVAFEWLVARINHTVKRTIVPVFCFFLVGVFLVAVTSYATTIYALQNQEPAGFKDLPATFGHCWGYSLSLIVTAPLSNVIPETGTSFLVYAAVNVATFLLISVFFSMFSAAMGIHGVERMKELEGVSEKVRAWIVSRKTRLASQVVAVQAPAGATHDTPKNGVVATENQSMLTVNGDGKATA